MQDDANLRLKSLDADAHMGPEELLLLDAAPDMSSKLKKAFCEPQKTDFCPPLTLVEQVRLSQRTIAYIYVFCRCAL